MNETVHIELDRAAKISLAEQIRSSIGTAIVTGRLLPGTRLPSWRDLAAQLGVARGTVKAAYERLGDAQLIVASGPAGTYVSDYLPLSRPPAADLPSDFPLDLHAPDVSDVSMRPVPFQMGIPAQDAFPSKLWSRLMTRAARGVAAAPIAYPDPHGDRKLRHAIAAYLAIARGISCVPAQVFITSGHAGGLGMVVYATGAAGAKAWTEDPGYAVTRRALAMAGVTPIAIRVDAEGLDVDDGRAKARDASLAIVTPGQQAPLGVTLSLRRRAALLEWAKKSNAFIIEDDYLSELQLEGRAVPALASIDGGRRVIHIGTFSKTISPALRLGFVVVPSHLVPRFAEIAACLKPAPGTIVQQAVSEFLREGHYLRHLRRMKRLYAARYHAVMSNLADLRPIKSMGGLSVLVPLPRGVHDVEIAQQARMFDLSPGSLSLWHVEAPQAHSGLLLGITNADAQTLVSSCDRLRGFLRSHI